MSLNMWSKMCIRDRYGIDTGLTPECERIYTTNQLLEIMQLDDYEEQEAPTAAPLEEILDVLLADACSRGLTQDSVCLLYTSLLV